MVHNGFLYGSGFICCFSKCFIQESTLAKVMDLDRIDLPSSRMVPLIVVPVFVVYETLPGDGGNGGLMWFGFQTLILRRLTHLPL